jgi:hypothetical protein
VLEPVYGTYIDVCTWRGTYVFNVTISFGRHVGAIGDKFLKVPNATTFTKVGKVTSIIESSRIAPRNAASPQSSACSAAAVGCSLICYVDL